MKKIVAVHLVSVLFFCFFISGCDDGRRAEKMEGEITDHRAVNDQGTKKLIGCRFTAKLSNGEAATFFVDEGFADSDLARCALLRVGDKEMFSRIYTTNPNFPIQKSYVWYSRGSDETASR